MAGLDRAAQVEAALVGAKLQARRSNPQAANVERASQQGKQREPHVDFFGLGDKCPFWIEEPCVVEHQAIALKLQPISPEISADCLLGAGERKTKDALSPRAAVQVEETASNEYGDESDEAQQRQADSLGPLV